MKAALTILWNEAIRTRKWGISHIALISSRLFTLLVGLPTHLRWWRTLGLPKFAGLTRKYPKLVFGHLANPYLFWGLTGSVRASALIHHYRYLHATLSADALRGILFDRITLWKATTETTCYHIDLCFSHPMRNEGELSLRFKADVHTVFILSFTVTPGSLIGIPAEHAILVTRLQGRKGYYPQIRDATKHLKEVSPPAVLFAALHGIAEAWGIRDIAGISAPHHVSHSDHSNQLYNAYDAFWIASEGIKATPTFYHFRVPPRGKPLKSIKVNHRARTKLKRQFKGRIAEEVRLSFRNLSDAEGPLETTDRS